MQSVNILLERAGSWPDGTVINLYASDYMIVAGGGGGQGLFGGGGGAGGFRESGGANTGCYTVSPLGSSVAGITLESGVYAISIGAGGACSPASGCSGNNTVFAPSTPLEIVATGGGHGSNGCVGAAAAGGSGGGGGGPTGGHPTNSWSR